MTILPEGYEKSVVTLVEEQVAACIISTEDVIVLASLDLIEVAASERSSNDEDVFSDVGGLEAVHQRRARDRRLVMHMGARQHTRTRALRNWGARCGHAS